MTSTDMEELSADAWTESAPGTRPAQPAAIQDRLALALMRTRVDRLAYGDRFVFDTPTEVPAVWGTGDDVLWAEGEPLVIVGPDGVGKTTFCQQLVLARVGLRDGFLGLPVAVDDRKVLYVAADRPSQARRSLRRMVTEDDRDALHERLIGWTGPLPFDIGSEPDLLAALADRCKAGTVVLDSLKDMATKLSDDEVGANVNRAVQMLVAEGVQVVSLHHPRKRQQDGGKTNRLEDVYGSRWITAGAGSVIVLWGEAGAPIVDMTHLKQPAETVGPWELCHDHITGTTAVVDKIDPLALLRRTPRGLSAQGLAAILHGTNEPGRSDVEKARRTLNNYTRKHLATKTDGQPGGTGGGVQTLYIAVDDRRPDR